MDLSYGRYQKHRKSEIPRPCEKLFQPVFQPLIQVPSTDQRNCPRWRGEAITRGKLVILGVLLTLLRYYALHASRAFKHKATSSSVLMMLGVNRAYTSL